MTKKKVALGLSGGVDSAVSAKILLDLGYEVTGVYLECFREPGCRSDEDREDALRVALKLGIPFQSLDFRDAYRQKVLDYLYKSYQKGETPNPDLACNLEIKFGLFYQWARAHDFEWVATGHYARIKNGRLYTARDKVKDQTYFLALVDEAKWERVLFPVGDYRKSQVRALAWQWGLPVAEKKDSTGVCFVGEVGLRDFLGQKIPRQLGAVVRVVEGKKVVVGEHQGVAFYTLGQRHGFKIKQQETRTPVLYVVAKDLVANELVVGEREELARESLVITGAAKVWAQWLKELAEENNQRFWRVRIRHQGELVGVKRLLREGQKVRLELETAVFAPSPGQFAVFYRLDSKNKSDFFCWGAGVIAN